MPTTPLEAFAARARSALDMPTAYWLGEGDWQGGSRPDRPGTPFDPVATLKALAEPGRSADDRARLQRYEQGLARGGLQPQDLPHEASDCSGFVHWALQQPREGWNTTAIFNDAVGACTRFVPVAQPQEGALVVYPRGRGEDHGHIGILVHGARGGVDVIHCDASNYLLPPAPGRARNAIAQTDLAKFDARPDRIFVVRKAFLR